MRSILFATVALFSVATMTPPAHAVGCLSGGAAGAVGGHLAGHGVLGAIGGCVAGHLWHKHKVNKQNLSNTSNYDAQRRAADPNYRSPWH